jgi:hypothetical protein
MIKSISCSFKTLPRLSMHQKLGPQLQSHVSLVLCINPQRSRPPILCGESIREWWIRRSSPANVLHAIKSMRCTDNGNFNYGRGNDRSLLKNEPKINRSNLANRHCLCLVSEAGQRGESLRHRPGVLKRIPSTHPFSAHSLQSARSGLQRDGFPNCLCRARAGVKDALTAGGWRD